MIMDWIAQVTVNDSTLDGKASGGIQTAPEDILDWISQTVVSDNTLGRKVSRGESQGIVLEEVLDAPITSKAGDARLAIRKRSARSGTGFDGPYSPSDETSSEGALCGLPSLSSRRAPLSGSSHKIRSDTSGSIDWEKNWPKRKPRRGHDVSEVSVPDSAHHTHAVDLTSMINPKNGDNDNSLSCSKIKQHHSRFHAIQNFAMSSCPELHRQLDEDTGAIGDVDGSFLAFPDYSEYNKNLHRHRLHMPSTISKRFRSLGRRLRGGSASSSYSIRSEFPATPDAKERRSLARNSTDIWPSSGEESPLFNTPESTATPAQPDGRTSSLLALAGMGIATAELERLSGSPRKATAVEARTLSSPPSPQTPLYPGLTSTGSIGATQPGSVSAPALPEIPGQASTPASGPSSPPIRPPPRPGQRRRGQRSRLSEVTTPEDVSSPADTSYDAPQPQLSFSPLAIDTLHENPVDLDGENSISSARQSPEDDSANEDEEDVLDSVEGHRNGNSRSEWPFGGQDHGNCFDLDNTQRAFSDEAQTPPSRSSSMNHTPQYMYGSRRGTGDDELQGVPVSSLLHGGRPTLISYPTAPGPRHRAATYARTYSLNESREDYGPVHDIFAPLPSTRTDQCFSATEHSDERGKGEPPSCHPDRWSASQGEPGDSEPFCPPGCSHSRHSSRSAQL
ncbi:hypothetical protein F4780DRAFT_670887 [Xylariomycetidae sp. FL0641]|nr:hypothetical protein F4780DRAFT_670887 [Xylariomycetidae sp. FL0641]